MSAVTPGYRRYVLGALTLAYGVNLMDRGVMAVVAEPVKRDLNLSDTQLGFVTGIAFVLFYATIGLPIARWADRGNRSTIISLAMGVWAVAAMAAMFITTYLHLLLARVLASLGEGACRPPVYSLVGDYYVTPGDRTKSMYALDMAASLAALLSMPAAGYLNEQYGWRSAFFIVGIPGLILAVLIKCTVAEPRPPRGIDMTGVPRLALGDAVRVMWHQRTCRYLTLAMVLLFTAGQGLGAWTGPLLTRAHKVGTTELGLWLGVGPGLATLASLAAGAYIIDRWFRDDEAAQLRLGAISCLLAFPATLLFIHATGFRLSIISLIMQSVLLTAFLSPVFAFLQRLVQDELRATLFALVLLISNLVGMGVGPLIVGITSDFLRGFGDTQSLRYAATAIAPLNLLTAFFLFKASTSISADLALTNAQSGAEPI
jgi:MFS family permease